MERRGTKRDPIPNHFRSIEEASEFWDTHDLGDYWDLTRDAHFTVALKRRTFLVALEPKLAEALAQVADRNGIGTEALVNLWLKEKLMENA